MINSRRRFIRNSLFTGAAFGAGASCVAIPPMAGNAVASTPLSVEAISNDAFKVSVFSKHLHWMGYDELADTAVDAGFDGIDLTVRAGGHVLPENVERDLPRAAEAARKRGIAIYFISTDIGDADDPLTHRVLSTASSLGIRHYRMRHYFYDATKSITANIGAFREKMTKLAEANQKFRIIGEYQNHSLINDPGIYNGAYFGSTIWDLHAAVEKVNSPWLGAQYDIAHATIEATKSWTIGLELLAPFIRSLHVKDFVWKKNGQVWNPEMVPIGAGMVDFKELFVLLKRMEIRVPVTFYYGYPIGDAKAGADLSAMKKSLSALKELMSPR